jgi:hypothetical protein
MEDYDRITVNYAHVLAKPETSGATGRVTISLVFPHAGDVLQALVTGQPASVTVGPFRGYLGADGTMRRGDSTGPVGVEVIANDPAFDIEQLVYLADFNISDPTTGEKIKRRSFLFSVDRDDVDLNEVSPWAGTVATTGRARGPRAFNIDGVTVTGADELVFHREDGFSLPPVSIPDLTVDIANAEALAASYAMTFGA